MRGLLLVAALVLGACKGDAPPKVSAAAWAAVEAEARPAIASGPPDELVRAYALLDGVTLPGDLQPRPEDAARTVDALPEAAFDAVEALVRWDQGGGRLPPRSCRPSGTPLATLKLARIALLVAGDDGESPVVRAVVGLAARHRGEGLSLLEGMIGSALADAVRTWATERGLPAGEAARRYQPTEDGLRRIIAAEAVCSMTVIAEQPPAAARAADGLVDGLDRALTDDALARVLATEVPLVRRYWIDLLADLRARPSDAAAIDRKIEARADALARDRVRHPVLGIVAPPTAHMLARLRASDDAYRAWLAGTAPPPPAP